MFVRIKKSGQRAYVQIVESRRIGGTVRQSVIANLGHSDELIASGALAAKRIGGSLLFGRLWQEVGIGAVLEELLAARGFAFPVERAVFIATLHRLFVSGSDRDCASWMAKSGCSSGAATCSPISRSAATAFRAILAETAGNLANVG